MSAKGKAKSMRLTPLEALGQAAECLKTLAHPHRLRMIQMLLHVTINPRPRVRNVNNETVALWHRPCVKSIPFA